MQREPHAYLADILESCDAIDAAILGMRIEDYLGNRLVRSSVVLRGECETLISSLGSAD